MKTQEKKSLKTILLALVVMALWGSLYPMCKIGYQVFKIPTGSVPDILIKQLGALVYVCFAFLFFKNEKYSTLKIIAALIGFSGIVAINYKPGGISFASGDWLIIAASFCTVAANVISKHFATGNSPYWITGISQFVGGLVLLLAAVIMGAGLPPFPGS